MSQLLKEFKDFAMRGNVMDMAIGVVIGAAFGKIVSSLVANILMPPIGLLMGGVNFTDLSVTLREASGDTPANLFQYGLFIQAVVDFIIVALAVFAVVKALNAMKKKKEVAFVVPPPPTVEERLLTEIRDLLKKP